MSSQERREDTRNKIQLGGLVIKAGLAHEDTAVLLGALLAAAQALAQDGETVRHRYRQLGDQAFTAAGYGKRQQPFATGHQARLGSQPTAPKWPAMPPG